MIYILSDISIPPQHILLSAEIPLRKRMFPYFLAEFGLDETSGFQ